MEAPVAVASGPHLPFLDGLRGLAALFVVLHHAYCHIPAFQTLPLGRALAFLNAGHYAVNLFIVLSGFCLAIPVIRNGGRLRHGAGHFLARRAWRILPPYYAALLLSLLLVLMTPLGEKTGTHWDNALPVVRRDVLLHLTLLHDFQRPYRINHVFWSIALETHIYFLFPLLLMFIRRVGVWRTTLTITAATAILAIWVPGEFDQTRLVQLPVCWHYVALFAMGVAAAWCVFTSPPRPSAYLLLAVGLSIVAFGFISQADVRAYVWLDLLTGAAMACGITWLALTPSPLTRLLESRALVVLGLFSYSLYLTHAPLIQVAWLYLVEPLGLSISGAWALLTLMTPLYLGAAYVFYLAVERPFVGRMPAIPRLLEIWRRQTGRT
jgi:peptidoglycan/LPS O-acetylase OafA/YrhL